MPPDLDRALAELVAGQHGVVSLGQLRDLGLAARAVQRRAAEGRLHRIHRGVYAVGHRLLSADGVRLAAVLACGEGAVLSHRSAAAAWGLRPTDRSRVEVTCPGRGRRGHDGVQVHRARRLGPADVAALRSIPITTVARTLVDLAGVLPEAALERAVHEAEVLRLLDVRAVRAALARAPGRRGTGVLHTLLATPSPGPTRRELERRFLALARAARLPPLLLNAPVATRVRPYEVDALWPHQRLIVELDGAATHHTLRAFREDRARDAALVAEGYAVIRLTWDRVTKEPTQVVDQLHRALEARSSSATRAAR